MPKKNILVISAAICLLLLVAAPGLAAQIEGVVKPQGLRSADGILVYIVKVPLKSPAPQKRKLMDQWELTFAPHMLPVLAGTTVVFPNNDKVAHNVFSLSLAKKFNLGSYKTGESKTVLFDQPGMVDLRCDVHQEMNAFILVLKNPFFALTDKDGRFSIPGAESLAPGKYLIKTWHEKLRTAKNRIEIKGSEKISLELKPKRGVPGVLYK